MAIASNWLISLSFLLLLTFTLADETSLEQTSSLNPRGLRDDEDDCEEFFIYLRNQSKHQQVDNETLKKDAEIFSAYSGHSLNDLGDYKRCLKNKPRHYFLAEIKTGKMNTPDGSFGLYVGLCLPSYCSKEQLEEETKDFIDLLESLKIKGLPKFDVDYIDPFDSKYDIHLGFWFYFAILVMAVLVILNIMGAYLAPIAKLHNHNIPNSSVKSMKVSVRAALEGGINEGSFKEDSFTQSIQSNGGGSVLQRKKTLSDKIARAIRARPRFMKVLESFDFHSNVKELFKQEKDEKMDRSLSALDGVRTIAFFGIVFAHTFLNSSMSKNEFSIEYFSKEKGLLIALAAFFGVDVFFILSGFLQGYQLINKLRRTPLNWKTYLDLIRHRWIRLAPTYFVAILIYWKFAVHMGEGPLWYQFSGRAQQCSTSWWKNVLFLDNVLNTGSQHYCFNWGWYLACDFQMFLIAPFICWIFTKNKTRAINVLWLLGIITFIAGFWNASNVNFKYTFPPEQLHGNFWADFYANTMVRMSTYLVGILLGAQYREFKQGESGNIFSKIKKNSTFGYLTSLTGFLITAFIIFYPRTVQTGHPWEDGFNYLWQIMNRPLLALGVFLAVLPTIVDLLAPIKWFLSSYMFLVMSKISYCAYLVQLMVILITLKGQGVFLGFSYKNKAFMTISFIMISLLVGVFLHLLIEKPAMNLEAKFLSHRPKNHHAKRSLVGSVKAEDSTQLINDEKREN